MHELRGEGGIGKLIWVYMERGGVKNGQKLATSFMDGPLCYEESLVSSNLNSKQLRFHGIRPNVPIK